MHQRTSKKIFIYILLFFILVTINNFNLKINNLYKINNIEVKGFNINENENEKFLKYLENLKNKNLFYLKKSEIIKKIYSNEIVEELTIFKNYPSTLKIELKKTKFLAVTQKNGFNYFIGSNSKLIKATEIDKEYPFVFGNTDGQKFLKFKKIVDMSEFDYNEIKNFYYFQSDRWDIETKNNQKIKLPKDNLKSSLNLLSNLLKKTEFDNVINIDLRQKDQIIVNE